MKSAVANRREFLAVSMSSLAGGLLAGPLHAADGPREIIDTHAHFYDPSRPQGVPWPPKNEAVLYRTVLPEEFVKLTAPLGVTGVIVVEASPWVEDNQWILDLAAGNRVIRGLVGNLEPGKPDFQKNLDRFRKNKLFLGIRFGALWGRNPAAELPRPEVISDLKRLADANLELDVVGGPAILSQTVRLTDRLPNLRIVIDHLPFDAPQDPGARKSYTTALHELKSRKQVFAKVSNVPRRRDGQVAGNAAPYKEQLDELWEVFGEDRVIYGSNWPVSDRVAPYSVALKIVREYFEAKGSSAADKYFRTNAQTAYRWIQR
jgi:L-fuconolactonase